jgi:hypothetical protein
MDELGLGPASGSAPEMGELGGDGGDGEVSMKNIATGPPPPGFA